MEFSKLSEDIEEKFNDVIENTTNLFQMVNIYYYGVPKQKTVVKVSKLNPLGEAVAKKPGTIVFTVVEEVFERLTDEQQKMVIEDVVNQVLFDTEKDKINIEAPAIQMSLDAWQKFGEQLANTYEICKLTAQQLEEEKKEQKAAEKASKKKNF